MLWFDCAMVFTCSPDVFFGMTLLFVWLFYCSSFGHIVVHVDIES